MRALPFFLFVAGVLCAQPLPKFEDFPAGEIYKGRSATPKVVDQGARLFRTRIREGAEKGPRFAGRYAVAQWGCGSGCGSMALVNSEDGSVHWAPFSILAIPVDQEQPAVSFRLDSRLLIVRGCPEDNFSACGSYYYEWTGKAFKLLRKIPAKKSSEP
jgi:hypothetical protein